MRTNLFACLILLAVVGRSAGETAAAHKIRIQRPWRRGMELQATLDVLTTITHRTLVDSVVKATKVERAYKLKCHLKVMQMEGDHWQKVMATPTLLTLTENDVKTSFKALNKPILVIRGKDGAVSFHRADGLGLSARDERLLSSFFKTPSTVSPDEAFAPAAAVAKGSKWKVKGIKLAEMFNSAAPSLKIEGKQVTGTMQLVDTDVGQRKLLKVRGEVEFGDMSAAAAELGGVEKPEASARMAVEYLLPADQDAPRDTATMEFVWSFSGQSKQNAKVKVSMLHRMVKKETLTLLKSGKE